MTDDTFTKFNGTRGTTLEEVFADNKRDADGGDFWEEMSKALQGVMENFDPTELAGYWPYKVLTEGRTYYPRQDTLRNLLSGWTIFVDDLNSHPDEKPVYVTVQSQEIESITWLPKDTAPAVDDAIPFPRAA